MIRLPARANRLDRLLDLGLSLAVAAFALELFAHVGNEWLLDGRVANLNAGAEGNAPTWASSVLTFTAAVGVVLLVLAAPGRRLDLVALAALLAWFSLDDIIQAHERVSGVLDVFESVPEYVRTRLWLPVYLPLFALAGYLLLRVAAEAPARTARFVRVGVALLVVGIAFEVIGPVNQVARAAGRRLAGRHSHRARGGDRAGRLGGRGDRVCRRGARGLATGGAGARSGERPRACGPPAASRVGGGEGEGQSTPPGARVGHTPAGVLSNF